MPKPRRRQGRSIEEDEEDEEPTTTSRRAKSSSRSREVEDEDEDEPAPRRGAAKKVSRGRDEDDEPAPKKTTTSGKGWGKVASKAKEIEDNVNNRVNEFWLADGESAVIQFYDDEPFCTEGHTVQQKGKYIFVPCQLTKQRHCLLCEESVTPSWKAIFKVADHRGTWDKDKRRFKHDKVVEKVWLMPSALTEQLRTYVEKKKKSLSEVVLEITRTGSGTKSTYNIDLAWDDDLDRPMKPAKLKSELPELEEIYAPPTDDYVVEHYI